MGNCANETRLAQCLGEILMKLIADLIPNIEGNEQMTQESKKTVSKEERNEVIHKVSKDKAPQG